MITTQKTTELSDQQQKECKVTDVSRKLPAYPLFHKTLPQVYIIALISQTALVLAAEEMKCTTGLAHAQHAVYVRKRVSKSSNNFVKNAY